MAQLKPLPAVLLLLAGLTACSHTLDPTAPPDAGDARPPTEQDASGDQRNEPDVDASVAASDVPTENAAEASAPEAGEAGEDAGPFEDGPSEAGSDVRLSEGGVSEAGDGPIESGDGPTDTGDGGCACVPPRNAEVTIPMDCFCRIGCPTYESAQSDFCWRIPPYTDGDIAGVYLDTFECNVIGITQYGLDAPEHHWFFDATTKVLIGAFRRSYVFSPFDPLTCRPNQDPEFFHLTIKTGTVPTCAKTGSRLICPSPPSKPDASDSGPDVRSDGDLDAPQDGEVDGQRSD